MERHLCATAYGKINDIESVEFKSFMVLGGRFIHLETEHIIAVII